MWASLTLTQSRFIISSMRTNPLRYRLDEAVSSESRGALAKARAQIVNIAGETGISRNSLSRKINGISAFTVGELGAFARSIGLTATELVARAEQAEATSAVGTPPTTHETALAGGDQPLEGRSRAELEAHVEACDVCTSAEDALEHAREQVGEVA
ncbi:MAG: hypothetical protein Q605_AUC00176G0002 [Actinomyces urogenitalis DORA_12]|uniref:Uncharacterized protein n=2 Tax=Actinomyces urogenitalis TaxID=103621 RepID=W1VS57_9ACTO|nr:MAG: hypothetical protein Q605_AUC00176G0002 [Actinomyces urogenitalis DORA_12]